MPIEYLINTGTLLKPKVSHSGLNALEEHPLNFKEHVERSVDDYKTTPSLERGDLLHQWIEKPTEFVFAELDKPAPQMAILAESFDRLYIKKQYEITHGFSDFCQSNISLPMDDIIKLNKIYEKFHDRSPNDDEMKLFTYSLFYSRKEADVDKRLTPTTIIKRFDEECVAYIKFLKTAGGKHIVSKSDKQILINANQSVTTHPIAKKFLLPGFKSEIEIEWTEIWNGIEIQRKAKIDKHNIEITPIHIIITVVDLKTTSYPILQYKEGAYKKYNLGRQLFSYGKGLVAITPNPLSLPIKLELYNIVVQTNDNFPTAVFKITTPEQMVQGDSYNNAMSRMSYHIRHQIWDITMEEHRDGYISI